MQITAEQLQSHNDLLLNHHREQWAFLQRQLEGNTLSPGELLARLQAFQVAIPSWALGAGGTRFGRFSIGGEPGNLEQKIEDVGLIHTLTGSAGAISLHIPWDIPEDYAAIRGLAASHNIVF